MGSIVAPGPSIQLRFADGGDVKPVRLDAGACRPKRSSSAQFLADDSPQSVLQGLSPSVDVLPQGGVDEARIVAASGGLDLVLEPLQDVVVEADRDPRFSLRNGDHRTPFGLAESYPFLIGGIVCTRVQLSPPREGSPPSEIDPARWEILPPARGILPATRGTRLARRGALPTRGGAPSLPTSRETGERVRNRVEGGERQRR